MNGKTPLWGFMDFDFDDMAYPDIFLISGESLKEAGTQEKIR
jgi:hypothetical protein